MTATLPFVGGALLRELVSSVQATQALRDALLTGTDPASDVPRSALPVGAGQLLLMPSVGARSVGVKVATVAPGAPAHGLARISAVYVLFDAEHLQPLAVLDGAALTTLRTPAVSAVAVAELVRPGPHRLVVFGAGPQARGHVEALRPLVPLEHVTVVARDPSRTQAFVDDLVSGGLSATVGNASDVATAGLVVCATNARTPVFESALLPEHACVVAVGSHEPDARELDGALLRRAGVVVVEEVGAALREAGDVVRAVQERALDPSGLVPLAQLVRSGPGNASGPRVFKSVGMAWEDRIVAERAHNALAMQGRS